MRVEIHELFNYFLIAHEARPRYSLVNSLAAPALRPVRKIVPPIGGLDLSPLFATLMIIVAKMLIIPPIIYLGSLF